MLNQNDTEKLHWKWDCTLDEKKIIDVSRVLEIV